MLKYRAIVFSACITILAASAREDGDRYQYQSTHQIIFQPTPQDDPISRLSSLKDLVELKHPATVPVSNQDLLLFDKHIKAYPEKRLIRWSDGHQEWMTEGEKSLLILKENGRKFVDVTDWEKDEPEKQELISGFDQESSRILTLDRISNRQSTFPSEIQFGLKKLKDDYFGLIQTSRMKSRLLEFSHFRTRYYRSSTGQKSQRWLLDLIQSLVSKSSSNVTVSEFKHEWGQNSIIARFQPHPNSNETDLIKTQTFVIGAHLDSTNLLPILSAPGADDDGSGTTSILEAFDVLLQQNWGPKPNQGAVEFMWYSAEEGGLLGSQQVARAYRDAGRTVTGMVQFDMTAYVKAGTTPTIGLITDFVDPSLTQYLRLLIDEYLSVGWTNTRCGYACSDHASWIKVNVPSAFAIESTFQDSNHKIHTTSDTIDVLGFSFDHMAEFSKLIIGLIIELKGL
ncbi:hypothetical protein O181_009603 [Austropuccinia psidii MF-1]|uniref:Peptide hydrolase n=1 Tax=Austropuccinia psidii MF-1 TaxID=1389203 RepID=A0A9Q3BRN4_9BASI|nr:hypothetical protein [Austropuccinia psidii MF-1]